MLSVLPPYALAKPANGWRRRLHPGRSALGRDRFPREPGRARVRSCTRRTPRPYRSPYCSQISASDSFSNTRSEEHTSELQSLMRISYAVFCLKKKTRNNTEKLIPQAEQRNSHTHHTY